MIRKLLWFNDTDGLKHMNSYIKGMKILKEDIINVFVENGYLYLIWWEHDDTQTVL